MPYGKDMMPKLSGFSKCYFVAVLATAYGLAAAAAGPQHKEIPIKPTLVLDKTRYIGLDEIKPGMQAYCLTVFNEALVEKFDFEVISVVRNIEPKRNAILVKGTDERFIHAGTVAGCSGSPVYIDGRLAGALAFGWYFSKDPLYGVTPIEEMLAVGAEGSGTRRDKIHLAIDFSEPLDLMKIERQIISSLEQQAESAASDGLLPVPIVVSGIPYSAGGELDKVLGPFGLVTVTGPSGGSQGGDQDVQLSPGSVLAVPLVSGDIDIAAVGTATEVVGNEVFGFGHNFLGYGAVNLPMATGRVHTVVASAMRSFKLGSPIKTVGTLTIDEAAAVRGQVGTAPDVIPMTINVSRYNDPEYKSYECSVANNQMLTPLLLRLSLYGAATQRGGLPPEHTLKYRTEIELAGAEPISYENISTNSQVDELLTETMVPVALLMNNPFRPVEIKSIRCDIEEFDRSMLAGIRSVDVSDYKVKQGEKFNVGVVVEPVRGPRKRYTFDLAVPKDLKPGQYEILITGGAGYLEFLASAARQRFIAQSVDTLIEALNNILRIRRDRLYCMFVIEQGGIALERAELPDLPATRALVLRDATRTLEVRPYQHWIERSVRTPQVIDGGQKIQIEVIQ
jgi:hypothetical protein